MNYLLQIYLIVEIRAVGGIVARRAGRFAHPPHASAHSGVAFCSAVAGFTLDVFHSSPGLTGPKPGCVAGKAEGVVLFSLIAQGLIGPGMSRRGPLLMLLEVAG